MAVALIVLLGFGLRLWRLAHLGDLEFDEIVSVRYASLPAGALLARLAGALFEHPPAYYLALGWWRTLVGTNDTLARVFSVVPGTLTIPLTYAVARRLLDRAAGTLAALLVALAPLTIFYSRETRMYALVACLGMAALWLFLRALAAPCSRRLWIAYALVGALATYVHYLGALLVAAQVVAAVGVRRERPRALRPALLCAAGIVALALPWAVTASGTRASLPALSLANLRAAPGAVWAAWADLAGAQAGLGRGPDGGGWIAALGGVALLALAVLGRPRGAIRGRVAMASALSGLLGLLFVVALGKPVQARYVLPVAPLVYACAAGALRRSGVAAGLGGAGLLVAAVPFWTHYYVDYARADYSDITRRIAALERTGDGVLLTGPWQAWYFDYYYHGQLDHAVIPRDAPPALDPAEAAMQLATIAGARRRLWFVQAGLAQADPTNFVERWLLRNGWPALREAHENAVLSLYALEPPRATRPLRPVAFGEQVQLAGGWVDADEVPAGEVVRLDLEFEALAPLPANYKASLRLVGSDGQRTSADFDLVDRSGGGEAPAAAWQPGQHVVIHRGIWAPASLGPQPYDLRLVVYDPATLAALPPGATGAAVIPGGEAPIGDVYVTQSLAAFAPGVEQAFLPVGQRFGGGDDFDAIDLVGLRWHQGNPSSGPLDYDLLWRLDGFSGTEHRSTVAIVDAQGTVWAQETRPLFGGMFQMHDWRGQETLAERRATDVSSLPAGRYRLMVGLQDARGRVLPLAQRPGMAELAAFDVPYRRPLRERLEGLAGRVARVVSREMTRWGRT